MLHTCVCIRKVLCVTSCVQCVPTHHPSWIAIGEGYQTWRHARRQGALKGFCLQVDSHSKLTYYGVYNYAFYSSYIHTPLKWSHTGRFYLPYLVTATCTHRHCTNDLIIHSQTIMTFATDKSCRNLIYDFEVGSVTNGCLSRHLFLPISRTSLLTHVVCCSSGLLQQ